MKTVQEIFNMAEMSISLNLAKSQWFEIFQTNYEAGYDDEENWACCLGALGEKNISSAPLVQLWFNRWRLTRKEKKRVDIDYGDLT